MKWVLREFFGLEDEPQVWATVAGQITSSPITTMRKPYSYFVNAARRLKVNLIAQNQKIIAYHVLEGKLEKAAMRLVDVVTEEEKQDGAVMPSGTPSVPGEVQAVQDFEAGVV